MSKETKFKVGDKAHKTKGYKFPCTIVGVFETIKGDIRVVGEMDEYGLLHIFNEDQLEHVEQKVMNKEQIIDEVYKNYLSKINNGRIYPNSFTQEEFINKCKTDSDFSEKWGLKIEERKLRPRQRTEVAQRMGIILSEGIKSSKEWDKECDENNVPTKLITLTYKNEKIESYEY